MRISFDTLTFPFSLLLAGIYLHVITERKPQEKLNAFIFLGCVARCERASRRLKGGGRSIISQVNNKVGRDTLGPVLPLSHTLVKAVRGAG